MPGTFLAVFGFLNRLADAVIVGHVIGEDAFAGVNLTAPALSAVAFSASLIAMGTVTNYSIWMGRTDRRRARAFFMQGLWTALAVGIGLSLALYLGTDVYLRLLDGSEYVEMYSRQYLDWIWPYGFVHCLLMLLAVFVCADGDIRLCSLVYGLVFLLNVAISYVAVDQGLGASGCALGSLVSEGVGILAMSVHFFRRANTFVPVRHFSLADTGRIVRSSFGDAATYLCEGALFFCLCKTVIMRFGSDWLPVAGVAVVIWRFAEVFNGICMAAQPLVAVYWGEGNVRGVRRVMRAALRAAPLEGLALAVLFAVFPDLLVRLFGIEEPELVADARLCVRLTCGGLVPLAFAALFKSYFLFVERPVASLSTTVLCYLLLPAAGVLFGVGSGGLVGVWTGLTAGAVAGAAAVLAALFVCRRGRTFPWLTSPVREERIRMFDLVLEEREIVRASAAVAALLPPVVATRAALMVEEVFMTVRERNPRRRRLRGEVTLDFNDGIVMTLRDDGVLFDITDADARISSLRTYLVASVMERQSSRLNLVTTGFNRNVFRFA